MTRRDAPGATTAPTPSCEEEMSRRYVAETSDRELLVALVRGWCLAAVVPLALDRIEREPLRSAGRFDGELLRGLMEVPSGFWGRHPRLHARFLAALRTAAELRRGLPVAERMQFWTPLDQAALLGRVDASSPDEGGRTHWPRGLPPDDGRRASPSRRTSRTGEGMATQVPVRATDATATAHVPATELDPFAGMLATRAMLGHLGIPLRGARVAVQGFGNVGASAALENVITSANAARIRATVVCGAPTGRRRPRPTRSSSPTVCTSSRTSSPTPA